MLVLVFQVLVQGLRYFSTALYHATWLHTYKISPISVSFLPIGMLDVGSGALNSGPLTVEQSLLLTELSPRPSILIFTTIYYMNKYFRVHFLYKEFEKVIK